MTMQKIIYFILLLFTLVSCKDDISINTINNNEKMVVYCFPTESDTTYMQVERSVPVKKYANTVDEKTIDNAEINYNVNGKASKVESIGKGFYKITGLQKKGDNITFNVQAEGLPAVSATTTIPKSVKISEPTVKKIALYNQDSESTENFDQITATFTDNPNTHDYYAVRVIVKSYSGYVKVSRKNEIQYFSYLETYKQDYHPDPADTVTFVYQDSIYNVAEINRSSEDLLSPISEMDDNFGFSNDSYQNMYIFDDASINGKTYTLHLNIPSNMSYGVSTDTQYKSYDFGNAYQVQLIHLTPQYYYFLKSLNEIRNNDMAKYGLSQISPTVSNVTSGLGLLGGWITSITDWVKK